MSGLTKLDNFVRSKVGDTCVFTRKDTADIYNKISGLGVYMAITKLTLAAIDAKHPDISGYVTKLTTDMDFCNNETIRLIETDKVETDKVETDKVETDKVETKSKSNVINLFK